MKNLFAKVLTASAFCVLVFGCKKNAGSGRLYLNLKSVSSTVFNPNDNIHFSFEFSHPNTETVNDTLIIRRQFFTCPYFSADTPKALIVPEFVSTADALSDLDYQYLYGNGILGCSNGTNSRTDSAYFYFTLKDKNGNLSETVKSPKIILKK